MKKPNANALSGALSIGNTLAGPYARIHSAALAERLGKLDPLFRSIQVEDKPEGDAFTLTLGGRTATVTQSELVKCVLAGDVDAWAKALKSELAPGGKVDSAEDMVRQANRERADKVRAVLKEAREKLGDLLAGADRGNGAVRFRDGALYDLTPPEGHHWTSEGGPFLLRRDVSHGG